MFSAIFGSVELGIIYAIMALGVYLSFRILDFPDLTVDGSFVTGAAMAATLLTLGYSPLLATGASIIVGFIAGTITGVLHTKGKINPLLSGILMMTALYSINLRIMGTTSEAVGRPNIPLLNVDTIFTPVEQWASNLGINTFFNNIFSSMGVEILPTDYGILFIMIVVTLAVKVVTDLFLKTEIGLAIRATGDNQRMIRSFSGNTDSLIIIGLGISNAFVAFSGALVAQYQGSADVGMGVGMIVTGLASVIIGEAIFGSKSIVRTTFAVIGGAVIYRIVLGLALQLKILDASDMKLITAAIVILALVLPKIIDSQKEKRRKTKRHQELMAKLQVEEGDGVATSKGN
ncbi:MAG TPA: ABC transporter permease [Bacillus sp. (in: firmicutes)]|uniref:ABC transporter permease n=1 Tax=Bacillus litorisediminis TaxID=2922713 RepID=UPI001FAD1B39|nr:ABC transporter permease [Bacillus litorisediminis]HWO78331.1 ABC transporter permease [Bacillus sp. (in: firmicutes)]